MRNSGGWWEIVRGQRFPRMDDIITEGCKGESILYTVFDTHVSDRAADGSETSRELIFESFSGLHWILTVRVLSVSFKRQ